jgi:hypothetical protein
MAETLSPIIALWKFFGLRDDQTKRQEFMAEVKELAEEDKQELAEAAAKALGAILQTK